MSKWFYQTVSADSCMKSTCDESKLTLQPFFSVDDALWVRLALVGTITWRFSMQDLVEEFLATGVWPLTKRLEFLVISNNQPVMHK